MARYRFFDVDDLVALGLGNDDGDDEILVFLVVFMFISSWSVILRLSSAVDCSNAVSAVCARQVSRLSSSLAQSAIMVLEKCPLMMSSICL